MPLPWLQRLQLLGELAAALNIGAVYNSTDSGALGAIITFTIFGDGTWTITDGPNDVLTGTPVSGTWADVPAPGIGADFEVQYQHTGVTGTGSISNGAIGYTTISDAGVAFTFSAGSTQNGLTNLTVNVRKKGTTTPVLTDTAQVGATGGSA